MRPLKAFGLGVVAFGVIAYTGAAIVAFLGIDGTVGSLRVVAGPLLLVEVARGSGGASETTFGPGPLAVALVGGIVNALAAAALDRRRR